MRSGIEVEKNNFKLVVEQFAHHIETVTQDIENSVKTRQQKAIENLKEAKLENALIFEIDDKPIFEVDIPNRSSTSESSIILNPRQKKRKWNNENTSKTQLEASQSAVLIANSF